jgi:cyclohexyl-isocyanide hydratase
MPPSTTNDRFIVGLLLFPDITQLDLTGPYEVFARAPDTDLHLIWKTVAPVRTDRGLTMLPSATFAECPPLDLVCVPGGPGVAALTEDPEVLDFLRRDAETCRYVTSVCTGSLVLGAAGLLRGYRASCHWASLDQLALLGAEPVAERVVIDRNRITGAGVTSGIDFALTVVAEVRGVEAAKEIQLGIEYDPAPRFAAGSPRVAAPDVVARQRARMRPMLEKRLATTRRAARALGLS